MPKISPESHSPNFKLTVRRWEERDIGEELHDRYILTDIGGVEISRGLDESGRYNLEESKRGTINISRLSYETWQRRLKDYGHDNLAPAFELEGEVTVSGV